MAEVFIENLVVGFLKTNCWIVYDESGTALIIDPGDEEKKIIRSVNALGVKPAAILLTHGHFDHYLAAESIAREFSCSIWLNEKDLLYAADPVGFYSEVMIEPVSGIKPDRTFTGDETFSFGEMKVQFIHTPGHSPGSTSFYLEQEKKLFTGDTLFKNSIGNTGFAGGSYDQMMESLKKLMKLPDEVEVYPGHGPTTTIGNEKLSNPFVQEVIG